MLLKTISARCIQLYQNLDKVEYIESVGKYSKIAGFDGILNISLKELNLIFPDDVLIKVRKNILLNTQKLQSIRKVTRSRFEIMTRNADTVPIGKTFLGKIKEVFPSYFDLA